jgi:hypothetical protein
MNCRKMSRGALSRFGIVLIIGCAVFCVAVLAKQSHWGEPKYAGKRLDQWLAPYSRHPGSIKDVSPETIDAIDHIGTNAIPYLLDWIQYAPSSWRLTLEERLKRAPIWLRSLMRDRKLDSAFAAVNGFRMLGSRGKPAIRELERLANNPKPG